MKQERKPANSETVPITLWLSPDTLEKLNKLVLAWSSSKKLLNRQDVLRELIEKAKL